MIIIPCQHKSFAEWNALIVHARLMIKAGFDISFFIPLSEEEYFEDFKVITYNGFFDKWKKLMRLETPDIYLIGFFYYLKLLPIVFYKQINLTMWVQGEVPEESFLRNNSKFRRLFLNLMEKFVFKKVKHFVFVSESMKKHYENKLGMAIHNSITIPCSSEFKHIELGDREKRIVYIGGLAKWQKLDWMIEIFKKIQSDNSEYCFDIITLQVEEAEELIKKYVKNMSVRDKINIFSISNRKEIPKILSRYQFGFLLREKSIINSVSSPIKFAEYLSCGVNVIISDSIPHYARFVKENNCGVVVDEFLELPELLFNPENSYTLYNKLLSEQILIDSYKSLK